MDQRYEFVERQEQALVHLAWHRQDTVRRLIFGWVEILPACFPPMPGQPHRDHPLGRRRPCLHVARFAMPAREASDWLDQAARGCIRLPSDPDRPTRGDGASLQASALVREPEGVGWSNALPPPFLSKAQGTVMVRGLFGRLDPLVHSDVAEAGAWLAENLFFDLQVYEQYQGGIFEVCTQRVVRDVSSRRDVRNGSEVELVRIRRWPGTQFDGHRLLAVERRTLGFGMPHEQPIRSTLSEVVGSARQDRIAVAVLHPDDGLCWFREPLPWLRSISMQVEFVGSKRRIVQDVDAEGRPIRHFDVDVHGPPGLSLLQGEATVDDSPSAREWRAEAGRRDAALASSLDLQWFNDQATAQQAIRDIVAGARRTLTIFDPYLGPLELQDFALAVTRPEVAVRLVTSSLGLAGTMPGICAGRKEDTMEAFLAKMRQENWGDPEVLVTDGQKGVHDRFIVADGRVWLSGNSLNNIGDKASVLIQIPNPETVLVRLQPFIDRAKRFEAWLVDVRQARSRTVPSGVPDDEGQPRV